jgi:8-oxo-dGTP pyrophosphatase MutT (NUDIX family)
MLDPKQVAAVARSFHDDGDGQAAKSVDLIVMLLESSPEPFSRHQFTPGHITCSGLVLAGDRFLIVHHRRLNRWLLPGGHVEAIDSSIEAAAAREVLEETGVEVSGGLIAGADVHGIPSNGREPYHLHHDLLFAFRTGETSVRVSDESHAVVWCGPDDWECYSIPSNIRRAWLRATH